jgi:hypothetical protein
MVVMLLLLAMSLTREPPPVLSISPQEESYSATEALLRKKLQLLTSEDILLEDL